MKYLLNFFTDLDKLESGIKLKIKNCKIRMFTAEMASKTIGELISKINILLDSIIEYIEKLELIFNLSFKELENLSNF